MCLWQTQETDKKTLLISSNGHLLYIYDQGWAQSLKSTVMAVIMIAQVNWNMTSV